MLPRAVLSPLKSLLAGNGGDFLLPNRPTWYELTLISPGSLKPPLNPLGLAMGTECPNPQERRSQNPLLK